MSHYLAYVIVPPNDDLNKAISLLMEPFDENTHEDGQWDWWQLGGRWCGHFSNYDPRTDPKNIEVCWLCSGTGKRPDMEVENGCNGCEGTGKHVAWPTQWESHDSDVVPIAEAIRQLNFEDDKYHAPYTLIVPDGVFRAKEVWTRMPEPVWGEFIPTPNWETVVRETLERYNKGYYVAVVDYHS